MTKDTRTAEPKIETTSETIEVKGDIIADHAEVVVSS